VESCRARGGGNSGGKSMKASQFIFKTIYLWALGELARSEDTLESVNLLFVHGRAGMRYNLSFFHQLVTQIFPMIYPVGAAFPARLASESVAGR
jgi:hypothetical protein